MSTSENIQLYSFDVDGTAIDFIDDTEIVSDETIAAFAGLHERQKPTTILTARPRSAVIQALDGLLFRTLIGQGVPYSVETGGRTLDYEGNLLRSHNLSDDELDQIIEICDGRSDIEYISYVSSHNLDLALGWFPPDASPEAIQRFESRYGVGNTVRFDGNQLPLSQFRQMMRQDPPAKVTVIFSPESELELSDDIQMRLLFGELNYSRETRRRIAITANGVTKLTGLRDIAEILGIDLSDAFFAGNDIHDFPILGNEAVGTRVLVGSNSRVEQAIETLRERHALIRVESPTALALFILKELSLNQ